MFFCYFLLILILIHSLRDDIKLMPFKRVSAGQCTCISLMKLSNFIPLHFLNLQTAHISTQLTVIWTTIQPISNAASRILTVSDSEINALATLTPSWGLRKDSEMCQNTVFVRRTLISSTPCEQCEQ